MGEAFEKSRKLQEGRAEGVGTEFILEVKPKDLPDKLHWGLLG